MAVGLDEIWERVSTLAATLRASLGSVPGVTVHDIGSVQGAIVTFSMDGSDASDIKKALQEDAINVSVVTPSSAPFDAEERRLSDLVRASVHYFNTEQEIGRLADALIKGTGRRP